MNITIMAVNKIDAFEPTQIIERLFHRKSVLLRELGNENQCPLHFILNAICHNTCCFSAAKINKNLKTRRFTQD